MKLARTLGETLLAIRRNYPSGNLHAATHSRIAMLTGIRSAKRVGQLERGAKPTHTELRQIAAAFQLNLAGLSGLPLTQDRKHATRAFEVRRSRRP